MFLETALDLATPLILAALGCLLTVRAGVVNIGIEGTMLSGAFVGTALSVSFGPWVGLLGAAVIGLGMSALLAWSHLHLGADIILAGIAINLIAAGGTVTALFALTRGTQDQGSMRATPLPEIPLSMLDGLPVLGAVAHASPITWFMLLMLPGFIWAYFNSKQGIWMRAAGDNAPAVIEAGISPRRIQWTALLASGLLAGVAGAQLSLFTSSIFVRDMVQGRGFIALAAVYLGLKHPVGTLIAAACFGAFDALSTILQVRTTIPTDPILALPYIATMLALALSGLRYSKRKNTAKFA